MATFSLVDATSYIRGVDFTADSNQVTLNVSADELDVTTFGSGGYRTRIAGLKNIEYSLSGFWGFPQPDSASFNALGLGFDVVTVSPTGAEDDIAYMFQAGRFTYSAGGTIGEAATFDVGMMGTNGVGVVRGELAKARGNVSDLGALGTGLELGAVAADEFLYATFHTFAPGTTITIDVESDDNSGFTTPTTQGTIGPLSTTGGTWMTRVAGPITDTWYRFNVTAVTGTFNVAGAIGIG